MRPICCHGSWNFTCNSKQFPTYISSLSILMFLPSAILHLYGCTDGTRAWSCKTASDTSVSRSQLECELKRAQFETDPLKRILAFRGEILKFKTWINKESITPNAETCLLTPSQLSNRPGTDRKCHNTPSALLARIRVSLGEFQRPLGIREPVKVLQTGMKPLTLRWPKFGAKGSLPATMCRWPRSAESTSPDLMLIV